MSYGPLKTVPKSWPVICLIGVTLLAGCSFAKTAYNNADWFILGYADRLLDLNRSQMRSLEVRLEERLEVHRRSELPLYLRFLDRLREQVKTGLTRDAVKGIMSEFGQLYRVAAAKSIPTVTPVLLSLSNEQTNHLEDELEKLNQEYRDEYLPKAVEQRPSERAERIVHRVEKWMGRLSTQQVRLVAKKSREIPDLSEKWLTYRIDQQQGLLRLLRNSAEDRQVATYLTGWWVERLVEDPQLEREFAAGEEKMIDMLVYIDGLATQQQRERVLDRIDRWRDILRGVLDGQNETLLESAVRLDRGNN